METQKLEQVYLLIGKRYWIKCQPHQLTSRVVVNLCSVKAMDKLKSGPKGFDWQMHSGVISSWSGPGNAVTRTITVCYQHFHLLRGCHLGWRRGWVGHKNPPSRFFNHTPFMSNAPFLVGKIPWRQPSIRSYSPRSCTVKEGKNSKTWRQ